MSSWTPEEELGSTFGIAMLLGANHGFQAPTGLQAPIILGWPQQPLRCADLSCSMALY
jgi:hypothetical protein